MYRMFIARLFILGICLVAALPANGQFVVNQQEINVKGITSFGTFECSYANELPGDTLYTGTLSNSNKVRFVIDVDEFGCGNFLLNRDFRNTLKAAIHPTCMVTVSSLIRRGPDFSSNIDVFLAGKYLNLKNVLFTKEDEQLRGTIHLSFEQLDLVTPNRLGGLIKVHDRLTLEIILGITPAS